MSEEYKKSGVNLEEADLLNKKIALHINNKNMGKFAGSVNLIDKGLDIITCCDGIGTKIIPLYERKMYKTIATDLIAANLNDLITQNAKAVLFSDYIAANNLDSDAISEIIKELELQLSKYDCKLAGGETSEMPDLLRDGVIDICGFAIGTSEQSFTDAISENDIIIGLSSNGIHANGFSLIRKLYAEGRLSEEQFIDSLKPSNVYYSEIKALWDKDVIKSCANITGGGIYSNINRIIPEGLNIEILKDNIPFQDIYRTMYDLIGEEIWDVFNCGVGFAIVADSVNVDKIMKITKKFNPFVLGKVVTK